MNPVHALRPLCLAAALSLAAVAGASEDTDGEEQARLDAECEAAREEKLAPERERLVEACIENEERPDRDSCERFYADYGNQAGNRAPLYLDLPACVKAFEHRQGTKR